MRNFIDKVVLIESENYKPTEIIKHLIKSTHSYELKVEVSVDFTGSDEYCADAVVDATLYFEYSVTPSGNLEWVDQSFGEGNDYIAFFPEFEGLRDWQVDAIVRDADHFLPSIKEKLKSMGFSDRAINNLNIKIDEHTDFLLTGCKFIHEEIINSYNWYSDKVGDI
jgi:hypothetical protein